MTKLIAFGLLMSGLLLMTSCNTGEDPVVTITSPDDGASFAAGEILNISGMATDDGAITRINIASGSPALILNENLNLDNVIDPMSVPINVSLTLDTLLAAGTYSVNLSATDDDDNVGTASLTFDIQ